MKQNFGTSSGSISPLPVRETISTSMDGLEHRLGILSDHISTLEELLVPVINLNESAPDDSDCKEVSCSKSLLRNKIDVNIEHVKSLEHRICKIIDRLDI